MIRKGLPAGVLAALAIGGGACEGESTPPSARTPTIDERRGTYRGVGIGSSRAAAIRRFGAIRVDSQGHDPLAPLEADSFEDGIPLAPKTPSDVRSFTLWRFKHVAMPADQRGRAWLIAVTARDAFTTRRVGFGSSLKDVRRAYPFVRCDVANKGTEYAKFPYCTGRVARGRFIWFGADPVRSVTMSRAPLK